MRRFHCGTKFVSLAEFERLNPTDAQGAISRACDAVRHVSSGFRSWLGRALARPLHGSTLVEHMRTAECAAPALDAAETLGWIVRGTFQPTPEQLFTDASGLYARAAQKDGSDARIDAWWIESTQAHAERQEALSYVVLGVAPRRFRTLAAWAPGGGLARWDWPAPLRGEGIVTGVCVEGCVDGSSSGGWIAHAHTSGSKSHVGWVCYASADLLQYDALAIHELAHLTTNDGHTDRWRREVLRLGGTLEATCPRASDHHKRTRDGEHHPACPCQPRPGQIALFRPPTTTRPVAARPAGLARWSEFALPAAARVDRSFARRDSGASGGGGSVLAEDVAAIRAGSWPRLLSDLRAAGGAS